MGADDPGSILNREQCRGNARRRALAHGPPGDLAEHALARDAHEERVARRGDRGQPREERDVVREILGEAEAGVERNALARDARRLERAGPRDEEVAHLRHHVCVARLGLHRLRRAHHVHDAEAHAGARHGLHGARRAEPRDVVHHRAAGVDGLPHHAGLHRVHGDGDPLARQRAHHRDHAGGLLFLGHRRRARPGGLAADIHEVRAVRRERKPVRDGAARVEEAPAVREGVRRDVDDPHHPRAREIEREVAAAQPRSHQESSSNDAFTSAFPAPSASSALNAVPEDAGTSNAEGAENAEDAEVIKAKCIP